MSEIRFELDKKGVKTEILQAKWMQEFIEKEARKQAGSENHIKSFIGFDRAKTIIYPNTKEHPN